MRVVLTLADPEEISQGLAEGLLYKEIAVLIGRDPSVISRDVARHGGRAGYRTVTADRAATRGRRRPKASPIERSSAARGGWSPASIADRLPIDYRDDQACRVSHEAIYQWIYAHPVSGLARELIRLRSGRTKRRTGPRPVPAPKIREPRYLDERPARSKAGPCPDTGKATWSSASWVRPPSRPWSNARRGSWSWSR